MKNTIFIITLMGLLSTLSADIIFKAKDAREMTNKETPKLFKEVLASENGKAAYQGLSKIINDNIARISSEGLYDTFILNLTLQSDVKKLLSPLSDLHRDVIRTVLIKELESKGFKVVKEKDWNLTDYFFISVSW